MTRLWLSLLVFALSAPAIGFAQERAFGFRQVWALQSPLAPGEVEILCLYDDGMSMAVMVQGVPAVGSHNNILNAYVRTTPARLREVVGEYRRWRGPPDGGSSPMYDCAAPEFANAPIEERPLAEVIQEQIAWHRDHPVRSETE